MMQYTQVISCAPTVARQTLTLHMSNEFWIQYFLKPATVIFFSSQPNTLNSDKTTCYCTPRSIFIFALTTQTQVKY